MNMLPDYIARKTGKQTLKYDHPLLEPILVDTYGVMVYQEQVQKAANILAGYSLGEADILRRAMACTASPLEHPVFHGLIHIGVQLLRQYESWRNGITTNAFAAPL